MQNENAKFKVGVFGFIFNNKNEVLLCHRKDYDLWNPPGGGLKKGELLWEGVIREVKEETGLDITIERLSGIYSNSQDNSIVFSFKCRIIGGNVSLNDEADRIEYFAIEKLPKHISPKQVERIKDILNNQKECIMKVQDGPSSVKLFNLKKLKKSNK